MHLLPAQISHSKPSLFAEMLAVLKFRIDEPARPTKLEQKQTLHHTDIVRTYCARRITNLSSSICITVQYCEKFQIIVVNSSQSGSRRVLQINIEERFFGKMKRLVTPPNHLQSFQN